MPNSGNFFTTGYDGGGYPDRFEINWSVKEQSVVQNKTILRVVVTGYGGTIAGAFTNVKERYINIAGAFYSDNNIVSVYNGTPIYVIEQPIFHDPNGKKNVTINIEGSFFNFGSYNSKGSSTFELPQIPRTSKVTLSKNEINVNDKVIISTNRASNEFKHKAFIVINSIETPINGEIDDLYEFDTTEIADLIYQQSLTTNILETKIKLITYINGNAIGESFADLKIRIVNSNPIFDDFNFKDTNQKTIAITENDQILIQNQSNLVINCNDAQGQNSASIKNYVTNIGKKSMSSTTTTIDFGVATEIDSKIIVKAIDSRSNFTNLEKNVIIIAYRDIFTSFIKLDRENVIDPTVTLIAEGGYSEININGVDKNIVANAKFRYKKTNDSDFNDWSPILSGISAVNGKWNINCVIGNQFDTDQSYDVQLSIEDLLTSSVSDGVIIIGHPLISFRQEKIGINMIPDGPNPGIYLRPDDNLFRLLWPIGSIYISIINVNPSQYFGGVWEAFGIGKTLVGVDINDTDFDQVEKIGGSKFLQKHSHTVPNHSHMQSPLNWMNDDTAYDTRIGGSTGFFAGVGNKPYYTDSVRLDISDAGEGDSQNLQPYITTFMFKRTG